MRTKVLAISTLVLLAGCDQGGGKKALVKTCVADGESPAACACIADAMEAKLSPDLFKRTVAAVAREKREVDGFISSLPDEDKMEFLKVMPAMLTCDLSAPQDE